MKLRSREIKCNQKAVGNGVHKKPMKRIVFTKFRDYQKNKNKQLKAEHNAQNNRLSSIFGQVGKEVK